MNKEIKLTWIMILFIFIILFLFDILAHMMTDKIIELEKNVNYLKEDISIQQDVFSSYLNNELSKDGGAIK